MELESLWPMIEKALSFFGFALVELTVLFIGISFLVALLQHHLSRARVQSLLSARHGRGYMVGAGLGALTPFCSCSTIPITAELLKARAGFGPTMAFLFASPLVNPVLLVLFIPTFGMRVTALYALLSLGLAALAGWGLHRLGFHRYIRSDVLGGSRQSSGLQPAPSSARQPLEAGLSANQTLIMQTVPSTAMSGPWSVNAQDVNVKNEWRAMLDEAIGQFKTFLPYVLIGVGIGAVCHGFVPDSLVLKYAGPDKPLAIPSAALIGVPLYVRASTLVPIAMSLLQKGMGLGAVMALIIGGAGASIPEMVMLKRMFRLPILVAFLLTVFGMALSAGFLVSMWH